MSRQERAISPESKVAVNFLGTALRHNPNFLNRLSPSERYVVFAHSDTVHNLSYTELEETIGVDKKAIKKFYRETMVRLWVASVGYLRKDFPIEDIFGAVRSLELKHYSNRYRRTALNVGLPDKPKRPSKGKSLNTGAYRVEASDAGLWAHAKRNNLLEKIRAEKLMSDADLEILFRYFAGKGKHMRIQEILNDFSLKIARMPKLF